MVIALSEIDNNSVEHRAATRVFKKIKRKRLERSNSINEDSDTSDDSNTIHRALRLKKHNQQNKLRIYKIASQQQKNLQDKTQDMEAEDVKQDE